MVTAKLASSCSGANLPSQKQENNRYSRGINILFICIKPPFYASTARSNLTLNEQGASRAYSLIFNTVKEAELTYILN